MAYRILSEEYANTNLASKTDVNFAIVMASQANDAAALATEAAQQAIQDVSDKQDKLTAGDGINITGSVISATVLTPDNVWSPTPSRDHVPSSKLTKDTLDTKATIAQLEAEHALLNILDGRVDTKADTTYVDTQLAGKQDTLTAGSGISITNNVISADVPELVLNATYGVTTLAEIDAAVKAGKQVICTVPGDTIMSDYDYAGPLCMGVVGIDCAYTFDCTADEVSSHVYARIGKDGQWAELMMASGTIFQALSNSINAKQNQITAGKNITIGLDHTTVNATDQVLIGLDSEITPFDCYMAFAITGAGKPVFVRRYVTSVAKTLVFRATTLYSGYLFFEANDGMNIYSFNVSGTDETWPSVDSIKVTPIVTADQLAGKQDVLVAGQGISIASDGKTISRSSYESITYGSSTYSEVNSAVQHGIAIVLTGLPTEVSSSNMMVSPQFERSTPGGAGYYFDIHAFNDTDYTRGWRVHVNQNAGWSYEAFDNSALTRGKGNVVLTLVDTDGVEHTLTCVGTLA